MANINDVAAEAASIAVETIAGRDRGRGPKGGKPGSSPAGMKDTFESILIALILAFIFRAFVVEAFVIPTGSMATTLLGAHMRFKCQDCGYDFTTNFSAPQVPGSDEIPIPRYADGRTFNLTCPNCGFKVPRTLRENPAEDATAPPVHYGDRILVLKYAYLLSPPQRWDVVVFRSPHDQDIPGRPLSTPDFQQNYIKRLVGLPGEEIMILDGDVYVRPTGSKDENAWRVQTKPRHVQEALWRIVADNDYQPSGLPRPGQAYESPWRPIGAKQGFEEKDHRRTLAFSATSAVQFEPGTNVAKHALSDWNTFNATEPQQRRQNPGNVRSLDQYDNPEYEADNSATDLKLKLTYERQSGQGPLRLVLTKWGQTFTAEFLPTVVRVVQTRPDGTEQTIGSAPLSLGAGRVDIEFTNVDYRVSLRINGTDAVVSTPEQYSPDIYTLIRQYETRRRGPEPEVRMEAIGHVGQISHLSLWRDSYYTNRSLPPKPSPIQGIPGDPVRLKEKEYFTVGDNSPLSLDARFWNRPVELKEGENLYAEEGRVPERFMLGKAFFVYWPAGYRPTESLPGIIPNFGRMRMIH